MQSGPLTVLKRCIDSADYHHFGRPCCYVNRLCEQPGMSDATRRRCTGTRTDALFTRTVSVNGIIVSLPFGACLLTPATAHTIGTMGSFTIDPTAGICSESGLPRYLLLFNFDCTMWFFLQSVLYKES